MSVLCPGCVKTCASRERAELFSPSSSFDRDCQCASFPIQRNRDKRSTRKYDVGVFTQPVPEADMAGLRLAALWLRAQIILVKGNSRSRASAIAAAGQVLEILLSGRARHHDRLRRPSPRESF
jgi:hypothetical protein